MKVTTHDSAVKVSVQLTRRQRILGTVAIVTWLAALLPMGLLCWKVHKLKQHMEEVNRHGEELVKSADELQKSTERLDESVHRFIEAYKVQQPPAPSSSGAAP